MFHMIDLLLTNDDGYQAIGYYPLLKELSKEFNVIAVAPSSKMSWKGKAITSNQDIEVKKVKLEEFEVYSVAGTPADCVQIGLYHLSPNRPRLVVSGINIGLNAGHGRILSSGTVGAGMEAAIDGVKALAASLHITFDKDAEIDYFDRNFYHVYAEAAKITAKLVAIALKQPLAEDVDLVSVNIPFEATLTTPVNVTSIARDRYGKLFQANGNIYKYSHPKLDISGFPAGTDLEVLNKGEISISPICLDLTSEKSKRNLADFIHKNW